MIFDHSTSRTRRHWWHGATAVILLVGVIGGLNAVRASQPIVSLKTKGFLATDFFFANYDGQEKLDCPDGLTMSQLESYIALQPPDEQARLKALDRREAKRLAAGPSGFATAVNGYKTGKNSCTDPTAYSYTGYQTINHRGPAYGLDLDGMDGGKDQPAAPNTCAHDDFTGPAGERGVDNQVWRVLGCAKGFRVGGDIDIGPAAAIRGGGSSVLIQISGIHDERNDPDVQVGIYVNGDAGLLDASGKLLPGASMHVHENKRYHAITHGKIVDGVLTTVPVDLYLRRDVQIMHNEYHILAARLRLRFLPDGTAQGILGGYFNTDEFYHDTIEPMTINASIDQGYTCSGVYDNLKKFADGYPDPKTGKCTAISGAMRINAIPVFVIVRDDKTKSAMAVSPLSAVASWFRNLRF